MAELNALAACPPSLVVTPHPVTLEGQQRIAAELLPRETLGHFLVRTVPDYGSDAWEVRINGVRVPHQIIDKVRPKGGTVIEVRGTVGRTALLIVAMVALTIFTAGVGTAMVAAGYSAMAAGMAQAAIYAVGSLLINKVLGPKKPKQYESDAATVYTIGSARNQARPYEPLPLVLGSIRIAPDIASQPYSFYESNDQFMAMVLTPGINVARVDAMFNGEALLSTFEGVQVWHSGFPRMPEEKIPLYSNVDTLAGGALTAEKGTPSAWVQRTSSPSTIRLQLDFDYMLFDTTSKGKPKDNQETIQVQYRTVGATDWRVFGNFALISQSQKQQRRTYALDVEPGQYEVRARIAGRNTDGSGATSDFTWSTLKSIQTDTASYAGIPRIGIRIKATGQLNGAPDELRCVAYAAPIPVWKGNQWITEESSNPGAQILAYARGIRDPAGNLIAGLGLLDAQIDIAALQAFMLHCAASKYTYDNVIRDTRSHDDVLQAIALAGFGNVTWAAGRLSVVWAADEQPLSGVVNMATIKKGQFQIDYTLANAADGVEFTYVDRSDWSSKTLRVTAPGVQTMLNPAQVSGEGITTEEHAAKMARYHLAQSLYQYKDISFSTDIEHLSYRRMSVLALQHDLTQWGFGGRLVSATRDGSTVVLTLDDQVRAPATGNSFIGLRIPGELVYRVFRVATFAGETDQIRLADPWPADAPLPGNTDENQAHDTIWIFDFKQTPGYRVRVVGIEPESDLKGASVSVVPEGPEFWRYVESGQYIPAPNGSLLQTRPVASNLRITEQQVVQGDTVFTELSATFDVSGPAGETIVLSDLDRNSELEQVAATRTRTATWRIPQAGVYPITVRPYSPEGNAGVAVTAMYATRGADVPPVLVDVFDVAEISGGVRRYTWGFLNETVQSADFAGVEIRYSAGKVAAPAWDQMTPLGDDGYHVAAFEAVLPPAGDWTFACRSRNTSGALSEASRVVQKTLRANLGEVIGDLTEDLEEQTRKQVEQQRQLDKETLDRVLADASEAAARARELGVVNAKLVSEAQTRANQIGQAMDAVAAEGQARAAGLLNEKLERQAAVTAESDARQSDVESLSRALSEVAAGSGTQFDSKTIWHFTTTVEGWGSNGGAPALNDGWLRPTNNSASYAQSPAALGIDGNAYRFIKLRMRRTGNPVWLGLVRWTTEADQAWNDGKSTTIAQPAFDAAGVATVDISDIPWSGPSPIRQVRIALTRGQTSNDYVEYDYIAIGRPAPGASVALVQEERQARVTALAAEASERNTLAVQMRGSYTGSELSQAQGFVGDERTARVAADSAQVQRISTMEARLPAGTGQLATTAAVTQLQEAMVAADQANSQATTTVNSKLTGLRMTGDNIVPNSNFATGMEWWTRTVGPAGNSIEWGAASGDGGPGVVIGRGSTASSPWIAANEAAWQPVKAPRRFRAIFKARAVGTGGNVLMRQHVRDAALVEGVSDVTVAVTNTAWQRYTVDWSEVGPTRIEARFTAYVTTVGATVAFDRIEIYDVTDLVANELTASGLQALTTRTSSIEGIQTAQATLIGQVQSGLAQTNGNVTAAQQAAQAAADAAGAKGRVIYGAAAPAVADRLPQNLWIDSTGNANTPKRWNGTAWAAVSDKVATDAAAAAAAAQQTANAAQSQATANAGALSTLDTKVTQQGAALTAQGEAITAVNIRADGLAAGLANIGGDNLLIDSSFETSTNANTPAPNWASSSSGSAVARYGVSDLPGSSRFLSISSTLTGASSYVGIEPAVAMRPKVKVGESYVWSIWAKGTPGALFRMYTQYVNAAGSPVNTVQQDFVLTDAFTRFVINPSLAGESAVAARAICRVFGSAAGSALYQLDVDNAQFQQGSVATQWQPSAAEAAAALAANVGLATTLSGKVTTLEGTTTAQGQAITTVSAGLAQANRSGSNMVVDGSFEGRASGTALAAWAVVGPGGRTGTNALAVSGDGVARGTVIQTFDVTPGRTYYAEAWVKRVGSATGGTIQLRGNLSLNGASATYPYFQQLNVSQLNTEDWVKISGKLTIPEGKNQLHFQEYHTGNLVSGQQILWDDFVLLDVTEAAAAQGVADAAATGLSALTTTVTQQGGQITALGQQVNQVGASVAGKADTQVVQTLTAMVKDTMSGGGNLLSNTLFKDGSRGWGWWNSGNGVWNGLGLVAGPEWAPPGLAHFGGFAPSNLALNTQFWAGDEQPVPVVAGKRYCFSAYINCHRVGLALLISFRDANGNTVGEQYSGPADATNVRPPITLERLKRLSASMVAPASAVYARVGYYLRGLGLSNNEGNYFWIFQPMLEEMREGQTGPSPYSAGGGETLAGYSLYVTADGLTGGMVTKNDGKVVDMKILANVLQILSPNQPEGIEMRDGYIRVWKGNSQRIIGTGFGGGDLMDYFGPNVGAGAANKLNATMWMDVNGNAYWGGSLSAGIWKNANRTSSTAANPYVEVGPFAAHGKQRVVVASFSTFSPTYTTWYDGRSSSNEPPPPAIASSTVLRLRRNVGAGLELVSQQAFPASAVLVNLTYHDRDAGIRELPNGGWQQEYYFACSGSFTATEPGSTFQNFIYEGAITTQAIPQIVSQTIAVVSTEEP